MRAVKSLVQVAFCLSTLSSLATAWPTWVEELHLVVRQETGSADEPKVTGEPSDKDNKDEDNDDKDGDSGGGKNTGNLNTAGTLDPDATPTRGSGSGSGSSGGRGNSTRTQGRETFDPTDPVGMAVFVTPDIYLGDPLYKAGDEITFAWNYTNVLAEPTAVDVILVRPRQSATWTLTGNMTFADPATYVWDSSVQQTDPRQNLVTDEYVLYVQDSDADFDSTPQNGYFTRTERRINIYEPRKAIPMDKWNCPTCSAGVPELDHRVLGFAASMGLITVLSFTWFVAGLDL